MRLDDSSPRQNAMITAVRNVLDAQARPRPSLRERYSEQAWLASSLISLQPRRAAEIFADGYHGEVNTTAKRLKGETRKCWARMETSWH